MSSPAGPCEWCGGPQRWTVIRGEVHVSCDGGCLPLPLEGLAPPPVSDSLVHISEVLREMELFEGGGVAPWEGADAKTSEGESRQGIPDGDALPF